MNHRPLNGIAAEIRADWGDRLHPIAKQSVDAMETLRSIHDNFHGDPASHVLAYFLGQCGTWRGEVAGRVKTEIKGILAMYEGEVARQQKLD